MNKKFFLIGLFFLLALFLYHYNSIKVYKGFIFGTYYVIKTEGRKDISKDVSKVFANINKKMSVFNENSEINKINNNIEAEVSADLVDVLQISKDVYNKSEGFFDPSVGALIELWGFGVNGVKKAPNEADINNVLEFSGFDKIDIIDNVVTKRDKRTKINLSAIAKGYAVDEVCMLLDSLGHKNYLVDIGGEVKTKGKNKGASWRVGVANPSLRATNKMVLELEDSCVATSGDYNNYFVEGGKKYSHTINPKTGKPVVHNLASVSVVDKSCTLADAYATAIMAMGELKAEDFIKKYRLNVVLILHDGSILQ